MHKMCSVRFDVSFHLIILEEPPSTGPTTRSKSSTKKRKQNDNDSEKQDSMLCPLCKENAFVIGKRKEIFNQIPALLKDNIDTKLSCDRCSSKPSLDCVDCGFLYCQQCFDEIHAKGKFMQHIKKDIDPEHEEYYHLYQVISRTDSSHLCQSNNSTQFCLHCMLINNIKGEFQAFSKSGPSLLESLEQHLQKVEARQKHGKEV